MSGAPLLRPKDAAAFLGVSVRHLSRLAIERIPMPGVGTGTRPRILYRRTDLEAYLAALTTPARRRKLVRRGGGAAA